MKALQCLSKEGLAKHNTQQPPFYSSSGLQFKVQQVVMPESLNGRFTLRSHCKDDSPSLFNQVICLGKLIWRLCMFFLLQPELCKRCAKVCLLRLKTSSGTLAFFCCRIFKKKLCTKWVKVQCCCFISTLCVCGERISLKTCSLPIKKISCEMSDRVKFQQTEVFLARLELCGPAVLPQWKKKRQNQIECHHCMTNCVTLALNQAQQIACLIKGLQRLCSRLHLTLLHFHLTNNIVWGVSDFYPIKPLQPPSEARLWCFGAKMHSMQMLTR